MLTISTTSVGYHVMKLLSIVLSFTTSFNYAFYASFLDKLTEEERDWFNKFDNIATVFFVIEFIFNVSVDEHDQFIDGEWSIKKSIIK